MSSAFVRWQHRTLRRCSSHRHFYAPIEPRGGRDKTANSAAGRSPCSEVFGCGRVDDLARPAKFAGELLRALLSGKERFAVGSVFRLIIIRGEHDIALARSAEFLNLIDASAATGAANAINAGVKDRGAVGGALANKKWTSAGQAGRDEQTGETSGDAPFFTVFGSQANPGALSRSAEHWERPSRISLRPSNAKPAQGFMAYIKRIGQPREHG